MKKVKNSLIYPERVIERSLGKVPVSKELLDIHNRKRSSTFKFFLYITGIFSIIGIVGLVLRVLDGFDNMSAWSYYVTAAMFIFTTFMAAPMLSMATKVARGNWRRPISRMSEIFCISGMAGYCSLRQYFGFFLV